MAESSPPEDGRLLAGMSKILPESPLHPPTPPPSPLIAGKQRPSSPAGQAIFETQSEVYSSNYGGNYSSEPDGARSASPPLTVIGATSSCSSSNLLSHDTPDIIKSAAEALQKSVFESGAAPRKRLFMESGEGSPMASHMPSRVALPQLPDLFLSNSVQRQEDIDRLGVGGDDPFTCSVSPIGRGHNPPGPRCDLGSPTANAAVTAALNAANEYQLKWIKWKGNKTPIITQNANGPCPLIAIMNVLLLKGKVRLPTMAEYVGPAQLMEYLVDCILNSLPKNISESVQLNYEQNMQDAIAVLPKLSTGLDVNVRFTSVTSFEFTSELIVFDLLSIPLYHGWLVDPDCLEVLSAVNNCTYNQLVEKIINDKSSGKEDLESEAIIAEFFLESTASQLTYPGLVELISSVKEDEPSVFFRNNHFITLYKYKNELYQLITDQGFVGETTKVWETLNNIEGDSVFVDSDFQMSPLKQEEPQATEDRKNQEDQDYLLALSLQEQTKKEAEQMSEWEQFKANSGMEGLTDEELAMRLQAEEDARTQVADDPKPNTKPIPGSSQMRTSPPNPRPSSSPTVRHHDRPGNGGGGGGSHHRPRHPSDSSEGRGKNSSSGKNCVVM